MFQDAPGVPFQRLMESSHDDDAEVEPPAEKKKKAEECPDWIRLRAKHPCLNKWDHPYTSSSESEESESSSSSADASCRKAKN